MQQGLFGGEEGRHRPLAARMRPRNLDEYVGQSHLVGEGRPLRAAVMENQLHSMILWGPPGVGKTTFARMLAEQTSVVFETLSAVASGVKDIRSAVETARQRRETSGQDTLLFVDEVHRFNKSQQDAFLPHIEEGTILFIGATTENPSFELNSALLSRTRVYVLKDLEEQDLVRLLERALAAPEGLGGAVSVPEELMAAMARAADGDARRALNILEIAADLAEEDVEGRRVIDDDILQQVLQSRCGASTKAVMFSTIRSRRCTSRCVDLTRMRPFTGCAGCWMAAAIRFILHGGWCALPARILAMPTPGR